jgi:hypothetical protein
MYLREMEGDGMDSTDLVQDRDLWRTLVKTLKNIQVS